MQDKFNERVESLPGFTETLPSTMINAYLDNSLEASERQRVEEEIGRNEAFRKLYEVKLLEKNKIYNAIPNVTPSKEELEAIKLEIDEVIKATIETRSENVLQKFWRFMDTPII